MNRERFMKELEQLLHSLPQDERREAIQFYNDYFDDAGPENEAQVIKELGSPSQVAQTILNGSGEDGEYTERGYKDTQSGNFQEMPADVYDMDLKEKEKVRSRNNPDFWKLLSVFLLCILLLPIIIPLFLAVIGVAIGILAGIVGIAIGVIATAVALPIAGVLLMMVAFYNLFFSPAIGLTLGGLGCVLLSVGILIFLLAVWMCKALIPCSIRVLVAMIRYPLRKAGIVK